MYVLTKKYVHIISVNLFAAVQDLVSLNLDGILWLMTEIFT